MRRVQAAGTLEDRIARHHGELVGFLTRRVPGHAEELAQETWLRVARADPDCADDSAFRAYAFTVARRLIIDHHRRRSARIQLVSMERPDGERDIEPIDQRSPDDGLAAGRMLDAVEAELARMKPEIAEVFRWRMTEDVSFKEIAARQGVPLNTALGRMHRATKRLAQMLRDAELIPDTDRRRQP